MPNAYACCSIFIGISAETLAPRYEAVAEQSNGYLVRMDGCTLLVDALATEAADWARQIYLATQMTEENETSISFFLVGEHWALSVSHGGEAGPVAIFTPEDADVLDKLPYMMMAIENALGECLHLDTDALDQMFGALLEGAITPEVAFDDLLALLACTPDWPRWSWFETIPEQLFTDPDLLNTRVVPLGEAQEFWAVE